MDVNSGVDTVKEPDRTGRPSTPSGGGISVRPLYLPMPVAGTPEHGALVLQDGSSANIRMAKPSDFEDLQSLFHNLSETSKTLRFFSSADPEDRLLQSMCDSSVPAKRLTLVVTRVVDHETRIIGAGSYIAINDTTAEFAVAVVDELQGKGIGTLLLERLSLIAISHGIVHFSALTHSRNKAMMEVFHHSGFEMTEQSDDGYVTVEMSVLPNRSSVEQTEIRERMSTAASMRPFFNPKSVAVIGASRNEHSIGFRILESLVMSRFQGPVYPVNPKASVVLSQHTYPSIRDVPTRVDLAVIVVPAAHVPGVIDECADAGVRGVIVISAGFSEVGEDGRRRQKELRDRVRGYGMRMIGPNCLGVVNTDPDVLLNASFSPVFPPAGPVAIMSQSGALGLAILSLAKEMNLGLSAFVSVGNKADVSGNDLIQYWEEDQRTGVILLYLESFGAPRRFARIARRVSARKPIVAVKGGRTSAGSRAAGSHTAAMTTSDTATTALFEQAGVLRVDTLQEMFNVAACLADQPLPAGRRVGIITNAGGPGILCADMCESNGLVVPELAESTRAVLAGFLPQTASLTNPVDMIASASPEQFRKTVLTVLTADEIDALIVSYTPVGMADTRAIARSICEGVFDARAQGAVGKPVLANLLPEQIQAPVLRTDGETIPCYRFPEEAASVLSKVITYAEWRMRPQGVMPDYADIRAKEAREICRSAIEQRGAGWLSAKETCPVLRRFGLTCAPNALVREPDEAVAAARKLGFPVAVKLASHRIVHKSDRGGVHLNLEEDDAVASAARSIVAIFDEEGGMVPGEGILVQSMIEGGTELMVGVVEDPLFGPVLAFGLGGIHVEILKDISFRITPLTDIDAEEMIYDIKGARLLTGYRGHDPADIDAIKELLLRVSLLVEEIPEIRELDLNPVIALRPGEGCFIADARIRVEASSTDQPARYTMASAGKER